MDLKSTPKLYNYLDGNGNKYIISNELIEYIPVKPSFSSSGVYNGGDYIKKEINQKQYRKLAISLNAAIKNKKSHIKNRVKISGLIIIHEENKEEIYNLSPDSEERAQIENLLRIMISN